MVTGKQTGAFAGANEKGKNEYFGDGGRRRKKNEIPPEGRVIRGKGNGSHFDCSI